MKIFKTTLCTVALMVVAILPSKADFVMNASVTAGIQKTYTIESNTATTATVSINNKYIYTLVSNAVANVTNWAGGAIAPTNLPADGYIAYSPYAQNATSVMGVFYATNKSGLYFSLSGVDTNGQYYSWIELDSVNFYYAFLGHPTPSMFYFANVYIGWAGDAGGPFGGIASYHLNSKTKGVETATSTAVFYVHDDPYNYDDAHNPLILFGNNLNQGDGDDLQGVNGNAIEVRGILTATEAVTSTDAIISSLTITGPGNLIYDPNGTYPNKSSDLVKNATVKFIK
jgi:hypothetical protein